MSLDPDPSAGDDARAPTGPRPRPHAIVDDAIELKDQSTSVPPSSDTAAETDTAAVPDQVVDADVCEADVSDAEISDAEISDADAQITLADLAARVDVLTAETTRFHARSESREAVLASMNSELEGLRRGERRALLRPLLTEVCRLRDGLLRQASTLPEDFDRARAETLLRSFADMVDMALEDNGVTVYRPATGDAFEPRSHRGTGRVSTHDPALATTIAEVRSDGYRDLESGLPLLPAQVAVYTAVSARTSEVPATQSADPDERRNDD